MASEADARAALQALLAAGKPSPKAAEGGMTLRADDDEREAAAGGALRALFRADIQKALRPPKAAAKLSEVEDRVKELLAKVKVRKGADTSFKPPSRVAAPAPAQKPRPPTADAAVQAEVISDEAQSAVVAAPDLSVADPPPEPLPPAPKIYRRQCVYEEDSAQDLRQEVAEARRQLFALDGATSSLTQELKRCRIETWEHQRKLSGLQASASQLLDEHNANVSAAEREEDQRLYEKERLLSKKLSEARAAAARWSTLAKRQDGMLQAEREQQRGRDVQSIFARHPAGEIFMLPMDNDSDEEFEGGRGPYGGGGGSSTRSGTTAGQRAGRDDASSDEDDEFLNGGPPRSKPPPLGEGDAAPAPPAQRWRQTMGVDTEDVSDASSVPSPSEGSLGGSPAGAGPGAASGAGRLLERGVSSAESSDDEEAKPPTTKPAIVPPLPELAGLADKRGRAASRESVPDEIEEEVYSDEAFEETSRSV